MPQRGGLGWGPVTAKRRVSERARCRDVHTTHGSTTARTFPGFRIGCLRKRRQPILNLKPALPSSFVRPRDKVQMNAIPDILQCLFNGLAQGSIYAIVALGFTIVFSSTQVVNFAQGEFVMLGAMGSYWLTTSVHWPIYVVVPAASLLAVAVGMALGWVLMRPLRTWLRPRDSSSSPSALPCCCRALPVISGAKMPSRLMPSRPPTLSSSRCRISSAGSAILRHAGLRNAKTLGDGAGGGDDDCVDHLF